MNLRNVTNTIKGIPGMKRVGRWLRRNLIKPKKLYLLLDTHKPLSEYHGFDRGTPLDRWYIEDFLKRHADDIKGECLEVLSNEYTVRFGGDQVIKSDILDIEPSNGSATIIDDLRRLIHIPDNTYDTVILTQVYQFIDDLESAFSETKRIMKPGGVLLATLPSLSRSDPISGVNGDYWRFTPASAHHLLSRHFRPGEFEVTARGNVRSSLYFYIGCAVEDVSKRVLAVDDARFPTIITIYAKKHV